MHTFLMLTSYLFMSAAGLPQPSRHAPTGPTLGVLPSLGDVAGGRAPAKSSSATPTAPSSVTPFDAMCAIATAEIGPELGGDVNKGNLGWYKHLWREVLVAADVDQFVVSKVDKTVNHPLSVSKSLKGQIKAGEPLLVTSCVTYGGKYVHVMTVDGVFEASFKPEELILAPKSFTFPEHAPSPFDTFAAYGDASPSERAVAPEMAGLQVKMGECQTLALGECIAAEKKVESGPYHADLAAAKEQACDEARDRVVESCMSDADRRAYEVGAQKIYKATVEGDVAFWAAMQAKLAR